MNWLREYFGKSFSDLNPELILEGRRFAVVRLSRTSTASRGTSHAKVGYILVKKNSKHGLGTEKPLHEGLASFADMEKINQALKDAEAV